MNYICTWLCADEKGEESLFPQTGQLSSSKSHQDIYWRCLLVFYISSKRFNKQEQHLLFTNVKKLPVVDGRSIAEILTGLNVSVVFTDFKYKTPKGYYGAFQNQFYEFSILEHIASNNNHPDDLYLVLDSDCIFLKSVQALFDAAKPRGFISFDDKVAPDYVINGLSRNHLRSLYEELLGHKIPDIPSYHLGEFLLCSVANIKAIFRDFEELWPQLLERHEQGRTKFNEEAHTLSYLYYKNGLRAAHENHFMKRIWTNPLFYRNVEASDVDLAIWHLPAEKTFGIARIYDRVMNELPAFGSLLTDDEFHTTLRTLLGIPHLSLRMKLSYYTVSYYRAIKKRAKKFSLVPKFI